MISPYYKQEFISPSKVIARVKEEMSSYFQAGLVDDLLFPLWIDDAVKDFRKSALTIQETVLEIENCESRLPPGFDSVREAWLCTDYSVGERQIPGSYYTQVASALNESTDPCAEGCDYSLPSDVIMTYKVNTYVPIFYKRELLLLPGNLNAQRYCKEFSVSSAYKDFKTGKFDIRDGKFQVDFHTGKVYLIYYSSEQDEDGFQMVPDNRRFLAYLEAYLYYRIFKKLWNTVTDETFNQIERKYIEYKRECEDKRADAEVEFKKDTIYSSARRNQRTQNRFNYLEFK